VIPLADVLPYGGVDLVAEEGRPLAPIAPSADGTFEFAESGIHALIAPVYAGCRDLEDLVAWQAAVPSRWWLRLGSATHLGQWHLRRREAAGLPVRLVATPQEYFQEAKGHAVCILNWAVDPRLVFPNPLPIICDGAALHHRLEHALRRHGFSITVA
jgi:hypothetical protein